MNDKASLAAFRDAIVGDLALMARMMGGELDRPLLEWLRASRYPTSLGLEWTDGQGRLAADLMISAVQALPQVGQVEGREELASDFAAIFLSRERQGFATESFWVVAKAQERRLLVEDWYERHGYTVSDRFHRPADTLAYQLGFLAHLLDDASLELDEAVLRARQFLTSHLLSWAPRFCEDARSCSNTKFYQGLLLLLEVYLRELEGELSKLEGDILSVQA